MTSRKQSDAAILSYSTPVSIIVMEPDCYIRLSIIIIIIII